MPIEMVEILDWIEVGKWSVEQVRCVINNLLHLELWSHFTRSLYLHSHSAHENTDATREITRHSARVVSLIYI